MSHYLLTYTKYKIKNERTGEVIYRHSLSELEEYLNSERSRRALNLTEMEEYFTVEVVEGIHIDSIIA